MKPYGNEHQNQIDDLNSTKHRPNTKIRKSLRRAHKKSVRAKSKQSMLREKQI